MSDLVIENNKDRDRYQESVAMGLSAKQLIFSIASVVCGGTLVFLLYPYIGLTGAAYVAIPVVAPIALGGFYSYNGMSFYEVMGKKFHFMFGNRALTYVSTEGENAIRAYEFEKANAEKTKKLFAFGKKPEPKSDETEGVEPNTNKQAEFEASKKKMKKMLMTCLVVIILLVGVAVAYKLGYLDVLKQYISNLRR